MNAAIIFGLLIALMLTGMPISIALGLTVLSFLFVLGVLGFVIRLTSGFDDPSIWGYHVATMSFIVTTFLAMPLISAGLRLTKAHWRRPLTRVTENMSITGLLVVLMLLPALVALPPLEGRPNIWFDFPLGAPGVWLRPAAAWRQPAPAPV